MTFVQLIECRTSRMDEMNRLMDDWVQQTKGKRTATHALVGTDRSDASHVVEVVEFPSYEEAMRNSNLPETDRIFRELVALCDEMPTFVDLDVVRDERLAEGIVRAFFEALRTPGELPPLNDLLDEDVHSHDPINPQDTIGLDNARAEFRMWRGAFDFAFSVEDVLAQGDRACARWTWNATHKGDFLGIAPTGRQVTMTGMTLFRFAADGKIAELWWQHDQLGLMQQLGALDALEQ
ncbi:MULTISPECIES: ester cyclase [Streptomyces]|uniref:Ester cyclase n=2 Tax=Streptomyces TaxID=1883 RepID=A0ABS9JLQ7_9ACTN|nr:MULTISPECIES: ester cyclase [Streptomyces]MCG0066500.1 ester cyclase [Streptomyces tricolor]MYU29494.1 ester cyclase [Streptomyces sp. SID7810]OYP15842.1 ester cyclase [Streptomyces sp. FBKL.4005]CUW30547.1 SnoaL-like polyketide cyclase [Streptomyces reticuli]